MPSSGSARSSTSSESSVIPATTSVSSSCDGAVLGAMRRHATPGEWRTNVSLGGRAEPCRLDAEAERLAIGAARAVGAEMAGVDLIPDLDRGRLVVLEVNAVPGWRALSRVTGIDVAAAVLGRSERSRRLNSNRHDDRLIHRSDRSRSTGGPEPRPAGADRLPARGDGAASRETSTGSRDLPGPAFRRLPR